MFLDHWGRIGRNDEHFDKLFEVCGMRRFLGLDLPMVLDVRMCVTPFLLDSVERVVYSGQEDGR